MSSWWVDRWASRWNDELGFDPVESRAGRTLARSVDPSQLEVAPGSVVLRLDRRSPTVAQISIRPFASDELSRLVDLVVADPMLSAGIVMGELPAAADAGWIAADLHLVPRTEELSLDCSCDEWTQRCRHLVALGETLARVIDVEPFVLLTLRGWNRDRLVDEVKRARASSLGTTYRPSRQPRGDDPGVDAERRFARSVAPLPALRPVPRRPGRPPTVAHPPTDSGIGRGDVERLVADAAARALAVLSGSGGAALHLDPDEDLARLAADLADDPAALVDLAARAGIDALVLEAESIAWRVGGRAGLAVARDRWAPEPARLDPARAVTGPSARTVANTVVGGGRQLRLDPDGRWWRFRPDERLGWVLASPGFADPEDTL